MNSIYTIYLRCSLCTLQKGKETKQALGFFFEDYRHFTIINKETLSVVVNALLMLCIRKAMID